MPDLYCTSVVRNTLNVLKIVVLVIGLMTVVDWIGFQWIERNESVEPSFASITHNDDVVNTSSVSPVAQPDYHTPKGALSYHEQYDLLDKFDRVFEPRGYFHVIKNACFYPDKNTVTLWSKDDWPLSDVPGGEPFRMWPTRYKFEVLDPAVRPAPQDDEFIEDIFFTTELMPNVGHCLQDEMWSMFPFLYCEHAHNLAMNFFPAKHFLYVERQHSNQHPTKWCFTFAELSGIISPNATILKLVKPTPRMCFRRMTTTSPGRRLNPDHEFFDDPVSIQAHAMRTVRRNLGLPTIEPEKDTHLRNVYTGTNTRTNITLNILALTRKDNTTGPNRARRQWLNGHEVVQALCDTLDRIKPTRLGMTNRRDYYFECGEVHVFNESTWKFPVAEQLLWFERSDIVFAPHGAHMSNAFTMRIHSILVEMTCLNDLGYSLSWAHGFVDSRPMEHILADKPTVGGSHNDSCMCTKNCLHANFRYEGAELTRLIGNVTDMLYVGQRSHWYRTGTTNDQRTVWKRPLNIEKDLQPLALRQEWNFAN